MISSPSTSFRTASAPNSGTGPFRVRGQVIAAVARNGSRDSPAYSHENLQLGYPKSERVLAKLNFQEEGRKREAYYKEGEYKDISFWGLLRSEFER